MDNGLTENSTLTIVPIASAIEAPHPLRLKVENIRGASPRLTIVSTHPSVKLKDTGLKSSWPKAYFLHGMINIFNACGPLTAHELVSGITDFEHLHDRQPLGGGGFWDSQVWLLDCLTQNIN